MAKTTNRLTAVGIKNLKEKGLYADGGGLYRDGFQMAAGWMCAGL
jgi:hypothetical protein